MLSIIVPVYNVEMYLENCVSSLISQDLDDFEIILIDDGSTDASGTICDALSSQNDKIHVIHKENGGLSSARNTGLKVASGDYIIFVDSDDSLVANSCKAIYERALAEKLDILFFEINWIKKHETTIARKYKVLSDKLYTGKDFLALELSSRDYVAMAWIGMYSREFLIQNKLYFKEGITHEDEEWSPRVALKANRIMQVDNIIYNYQWRANSITSNNALLRKRANDLLQTAKELFDIYSKESGTLSRNGCYYATILYMKSISQLYMLGQREKIEKRYISLKIKSIRGFVRRTAFLISPQFYGKLFLR